MAIPARAAEDEADLSPAPDYVPGWIQAHGALLAFAPSGELATCSENATMLGALPRPGQPPDDGHLTGDILKVLRAGFAGALPDCTEVRLPDGRSADLVLHGHGGLLLAEIEPHIAGNGSADVALLSQRALARIQSQRDIAALLEAGVDEIATLSGYDRVMGYRFLPDGSAEVSAEHLRGQLEACVGLRYPACDFPEHARRHFVAHPLRLVADVKSGPQRLTPDHNPFTGGSIDLTPATLRSIPQGHCDYMASLGVSGWMAVAIVAQDRLWGMFACHHYSPRWVGPRVREACRLVAQLVGLMVERMVAVRRTEEIARGQRLRTAIIEQVRADDYVLHALASGNPSALDVVPACGLIAGRLEQVQLLGDAPAEAQAASILAWLENLAAPRFATASIAREVPELTRACAGYAGMLAIRYSPERHCWLVWLRRERVQELRWAGAPDRRQAASVADSRPPAREGEWREVVRDRAEPWGEPELYEAEELRLALADISATRLQEAARAREVLLAMLGHDLRTPVQALAMVGETLWFDDARIAGVQKQIARISGRMGRLITHVLDLSRLQAGFTLIGARERRDFGELLSDVINEARLARPKSPLLASFSDLGVVSVDADRITQVLANLISNARHHGLPGHPVRVEAERTVSQVLVRVINHGRPVSEAALERLFEPFKRGSLDNTGNPRGLGMGLYIASTIVREHGGSLSLSCGEGLVTFTVALPVHN